jgi:hypothetical protein
MRALFCPSFSAQVSIPCGLVSVDGVKTLGRQLAEATRPLVLAAAYTSVHRRDENSGDFSAEVCRAIDGAIAGANLEPRSPFACSATSLAKGIISDAFVAIDRIVARVNAGDAADLLLYTLGETLLVDWNGLAKQPEEPTVPVLSQRLANW